MIHLRIVLPAATRERVLAVLEDNGSVCNIIVLPGVARRPSGDVILCDVAREDASVVIEDLRALGIVRDGSKSLETIDSQLSATSERAVDAARGAPADAVVWEEVEEHTSESATLSFTFLAFMALAALIAAVGIFLDSGDPHRRRDGRRPEVRPDRGVLHRDRATPALARAAVVPGARGRLPLAIGAVTIASLISTATGLTPQDLEPGRLATSNASPDFFAFFVAICAGAAGMLSLSTSKSGALIGVLISVTTIPPAANVGISAASRDWSSFEGSLGQLGVNLAGIPLAGTGTLAAQRGLYARRRRRHLRELTHEG